MKKRHRNTSPTLISKLKPGLIFWSALITIIVTRLLLWLSWYTPFMIESKTDMWHHFHTGILFILTSYFAKNKYRSIMIGVGLGLIIDEAALPYAYAGLWIPDYWSLELLVLVGVLLIGLYIYDLQEH